MYTSRESKRAQNVRRRKETRMNKLYAMVLLAISLVPVFMVGDLTVLIAMSFFFVPLFFAKENWIM